MKISWTEIPHLYSIGKQNVVKKTWLSFAKAALSQNPRKFKYGLEVIDTLLRSRPIIHGDRVEYYLISMNQFQHIRANLKGDNTYNYTTKN